ncbi:MAG TPA: phosphatase PAP2 family protein [Steroidobacteraceae bacterium]|nr:phosphatase PAP2 family protein [Steroidobacteraceae bacterium]
MLSDIAAYFTAPLHWDASNWEYFGGTLAAIAVAHEFDSRVRTDFTRGSSNSLNGSDSDDFQDALPAAGLLAGTWLYSGLFHDANGLTATGAMAEAGGLSVVTAYLLQYAAGREGPNQTTDPNEWRAGGSSFPSVHATAAFAVGTVFAESGSGDYLWLTRFIGYGVAVATSYERLDHNAHWLSDIVAGAGLGASSAVFVLNRTYGRNSGAQIGVAPLEGGGFLLTYRTTLD